MPGTSTKRGHPNIIGTDKGVGRLEAQIIRALTQLTQPTTMRDVCEEMGANGCFAYQGVLNCMNRLVGKRIPERRQEGRAYRYRLLVDLEDRAAVVLANVLEHFGTDPDRVVCRLLRINPDRGASGLAKLRQRLQRRNAQ